MSWHEGRLCVFDTETTGKDPRTARIVTACVALVGGGRDIEVRSWLVNPGVPIPNEAAAIHGVTTERAQVEGQDPQRSAVEILTALVDAWSQGIPVIIFNAAYDLTVMDQEQRRHDIDPWGMTPWPSAWPVIDPFVIDRYVDPYRRGSRKLVDMCAHYGVRLDDAHNAEADAVAAGRVAWAIARRYPEIADMSLASLHTAQAVWHAARQADFRAYLERQGKPADDVSGEWPIQSVEVTV